MPIKQSAKKALRQSVKRAERNKVFKDAYKKAIKAADKALAAGEKDLKALVQTAQTALDKAAKRGIIKPNTAARKLSRLAKRVQKVAK